MTIKSALANAKIEPYWLDDPARPEPEPGLNQNISCDLLIVGGGFTGLWTALQAIEQNPDRDVVLIEASTIPIGASARACAMFNTSVLHGLKNAERLFNDDLKILEDLGRQNFDDLLETLDRHKIDAAVEINGELTVAVGEEAVDDLREEYEKHRSYDHDVEFLDKDQVRSTLNSPLFFGAMHTRSNAGILHPVKLCWGLKAAILKLGVRVFENTPLTDVKDANDHLVALCNGHEISAKKAVFGTNAFAVGHKKIRQRVTCIRDRILVTEPLSDAQIDALNWGRRQAAYDTRVQLNYFRLTPDNRMLFGGRLAYSYGDKTSAAEDETFEPYEMLAANWLKTFPQLEGTKIDYLWSGPLGVTTRMAVHFQPYFGGRALYVGGYSGFGVAATRFGAGLGLAILDDRPHPARHLEIATRMPRRIPPEPFRWIGAKITMNALDHVDEKGGWRKLWLRFVMALGFPLY